jgi:hypothetical protein
MLGAVDALGDVPALAGELGEAEPTALGEELAVWLAAGAPHAANNSTPTNKTDNVYFMLISFVKVVSNQQSACCEQ